MKATLFAATVVAAALLSATAALCAEPLAKVEGQLDAGLRTEIVKAVGDVDKPVENRFEARRRALDAAESTIAVLRSEGYYANTVEPAVGEGDQPAATVKVTPGPRFKIAGAKVDWGQQPPDEGAQAQGVKAMGLKDGEPGRAVEVIAAEGRIVAAVQKRGYADAAAGVREVIVDHADQTVQPTFRIAAGELVRLDGVDLTSAGRTSKAWLQRLAPWKKGAPYDPEDVAELERRLLDTGVYDSVTVALAPREKTDAAGLRPVVVSLADRPPRSIELGASYATTEGVGLDAKWTHYNVLGRADTFAVTGLASDLENRLSAELTLPHWRRPQQTLKLGSAVYNTNTDAYDETGVGVRADLERRFAKTSYFTYGTTLDLSRTKEVAQTLLNTLGRDIVTAAVFAGVTLDRSDDPLDPRHGWRLQAQAEPTLLLGDENLPYLKLQATGSAYMPFGVQARTVLAGRVKLGEIIGGSIPQVPASRRFYSGGGGSVRGYSYQAIGPRLADNTPTGGLSVLEASIELRQKLTPRWGVVAFIDAGAVGASQFPKGGDLSAGVGVGVRYDLGFGPIRFDIATPLDKRQGDPAIQIYLSIGQSF